MRIFPLLIFLFVLPSLSFAEVEAVEPESSATAEVAEVVEAPAEEKIALIHVKVEAFVGLARRSVNHQARREGSKEKVVFKMSRASNTLTVEGPRKRVRAVKRLARRVDRPLSQLLNPLLLRP